MKAKVIATGAEIEVTENGLSWWDEFRGYGYIDKATGKKYRTTELDVKRRAVDNPFINWEKRRYEIAKEMLAAIETNSDPLMYQGGNAEEQSKWAVMFADALIAELKK